MKTRKWLYYLGSYYEVVRFVAVTLVLVPVFNPFGHAGSKILLMSLVAPLTLFAAAFFFLGRNEERYHVYVPLLILGKSIQLILNGLFMFIFFGAAHALVLWIPALAPLSSGYPELILSSIPALVPVVTFVLDLLFLLFLLSCRRSPKEF